MQPSLKPESLTVRALGLNVCGFGSNGRFSSTRKDRLGAPSLLYCRDEERMTKIADQFMKDVPDVIGLCEVWGEDLASLFKNKLGGSYVSCEGPYGPGISAIFKQIKKQHPRLSRIMEMFPGYAVRYFVNADARIRNVSPKAKKKALVEGDDELDQSIAARMQKLIEGQLFMGAGLMIFSRHEMIAHGFEQFQDSYGFEKHVQKGFLWADICQDNFTYRAVVTHLQQGKGQISKGDNPREVRRRQTLQMRAFLKKSPHPVFVMGDFNPEDEKEFQQMVSRLKLRDADAESRQPTFKKKNFIADRLGRSKIPGPPTERLDAILYNSRYFDCAEGVYVDTMIYRDQKGKRHPWSDHSPVEVVLTCKKS